jgi:hypothetical protein
MNGRKSMASQARRREAGYYLVHEANGSTGGRWAKKKVSRILALFFPEGLFLRPR